jgi:putative hemolysin
MFNVEQIVTEHFPTLSKRSLLFGTLNRTLRLILRERDFVDFASAYPHLRGMDFIEQVLSYFDFGYSLRMNERERIPVSGSVVIVANHPIGSLDGLALLQMVHAIRPDVKVIANNLLQKIEPLSSLLLPVNNMQGNTSLTHIRAIHYFLQNTNGALIVFPAGEVSRLGPQGIKDGKWSDGFVRIAKASRSKIVPVFIDGKNSPLFYGMSILYRPLSMLWLVREMFKQRHHAINMRIGEPIVYDTYASMKLPDIRIAKLFRKHLYKIGKDKSPVFKTETAIALPENRQALRQEIRQGVRLGTTRDGKQIYLHDYVADSALMREVARLREVSFRAVGEGCGKRRDTDNYDLTYQHMILWDDNDLEVAGAYRWRPTTFQFPVDQLYSNELFHFDVGFSPVLESGLELGRSFIQPRYWGRRGLDYLWHGIGLYLKTRPDIRYLFGPVSISQQYSPRAIAMLVYFYRLYFGVSQSPVKAKLPYRLSSLEHDELVSLFAGDDYQADFCILKVQLQQMGFVVPTLYKQYTELCEEGGARFFDFNIDPNFANCIDGLIVIDLQKVKKPKMERYVTSP